MFRKEWDNIKAMEYPDELDDELAMLSSLHRELHQLMDAVVERKKEMRRAFWKNRFMQLFEAGR